MAYATAGLKLIHQSGPISDWVLFTVDALAAAVGAGYITDAGPAASGKGAPGRGMRVGDRVTIFSGADSATAPTSITKGTPAYVSAVNATTGAGSLTVVALS